MARMSRHSAQGPWEHGRGPVIRMKSEGKRQTASCAVAAGRVTPGWVEQRGGLLVLSAHEWQPHRLTPIQSSLCQSQMVCVVH